MSRASGWLAAVVGAVLVASCSAGSPPSRRPRPTTHAVLPSGTATATATASARTVASSLASENRHQGSRGWLLPARTPDVQGFADATSVLPGHAFRLFVSTGAATFTVTAYRIGWYQGWGGRQVWRSAPIRGHRQPGPRTTPGVLTVTAPWSPVTTVSTAGWPPGCYVLVLTPSSGAPGYVPITVRSPSTAGTVVLLDAVTTWQAYNHWGGRSLYSGPDGGYASRSRVASFDRPYDKSGASMFFDYEAPLVRIAERTGVALSYATDVDLHADPHLLDGARGVVTMGHDEYWTTAMRAAVTRARDRGVNVAFFGANAVYRRIRLEPSPLGADRLEVSYKSAAEDPLHGRDDAQVTVNWRDPPHPVPESSLTGMLFACDPGIAAMTITRPTAWVFAGTGATPRTRLPGVVGVEFDSIDLSAPTPRPIESLAHSLVLCGGRHWVSDMSWYTVPSGAGVFATGTMRWVRSLVGNGLPSAQAQQVERLTQQVTTNVLRAFAAGPAGRAHPVTHPLR